MSLPPACFLCPLLAPYHSTGCEKRPTHYAEAASRRLGGAEHTKEAQKIGQEMDKVTSDPHMKPKDKEKKLGELQKKLDHELRGIRPPFSLGNLMNALNTALHRASTN